eukprot:754747-Hanusia_phi.AAC.1
MSHLDKARELHLESVYYPTFPVPLPHPRGIPSFTTQARARARARGGMAGCYQHAHQMRDSVNELLKDEDREKNFLVVCSVMNKRESFLPTISSAMLLVGSS